MANEQPLDLRKRFSNKFGIGDRPGGQSVAEAKAALSNNPVGARMLETSEAGFAARKGAIEQNNMRQMMGEGNFAGALGGGLAAGGLAAATGFTGNKVVGQANALVGALGAGNVGNMLIGNFAGPQGDGGARNAEIAAGWAGAMADAQNDKAREQIVAGGQAQADSFNINAQNQQGQMTDAAIAQANHYQAGMQGIAQSGIEGSENMERNLQYGQDRADAQEQLAFDIQGQQAQGIQDSMVQSFDQLSQGKAAAMQGAWGGSMADQLGAQDAARTAAQDYEMRTQVTMAEKNAAVLDAARAAEESGVPDAEAPAGAAPAAAPAQNADFMARMKGVDISGLESQGITMDYMRQAYEGDQAAWNAAIAKVNNTAQVKASGKLMGQWMKR